MILMNRRTRFLLAFFVFGIAACGSDSGSGDGDEGNDGFTVFPPRAYSGFDGTNTYKAPLHAQNTASNVEWSIDDNTVAEIQPSGTNNQDLMVTTKKAGRAKITAKHGGVTKTVDLQVNAYTLAQWQAGERRYNTALDEDNPACITCHAPEKGANHSPAEVNRDPDADLITIVKTGVDPEENSEEEARIADRAEFRTLLNGRTHEWTITTEEETGLIAYIRSLEPKGRPALDND